MARKKRESLAQRLQRESLEDQYCASTWKEAAQIVERVKRAHLGWGKLEVSLPEAVCLEAVRVLSPAGLRAIALFSGKALDAIEAADRSASLRSITDRIQRLIKLDLLLEDDEQFRLTVKAWRGFAVAATSASRRPARPAGFHVYRVWTERNSLGEEE